MSQDEDSRAKDLLPPDSPPEDHTETRKIGVRRVVGWQTVDAVMARADVRPVGNSRRFWKKIEADDPFKRKPLKPADYAQEVYVAERLPRVQTSTVQRQPAQQTRDNMSSQSSPQRPQSRTQPQRVAKPPQRTPEPTHPRDTQTAKPPPQPRRAAPVPPPSAEPEAAAPPIDRRPPRIMPDSKSPKTGRVRASRTRIKTPSKPATQTKSAAEIREEKRRVRSGEPEQDIHKIAPKRSLDDYMEYMRNMAYAKELYDQGLEVPSMSSDEMEDSTPAPRPKPTRAAQADPPAEPKSPPIDRRPPMPKKAAPKAPQTPRRPASGTMDDLFGGGGPDEGRVRIGRRDKPTGKSEDS